MNLGVGQGELSVTPLQLARYTAAVANGSVVPVPHLVQRILHPETDEALDSQIEEARPLPFDPDFVGLVRDAMRETMEEGTGRWIQIPGVASGGKTGTAQNPRGKDDSVFIMFAPYESPTIAIAVLVENAGFGASAAGPIASLLAEKHVTGGIAPGREYLVRNMLALASDPLPEPANQ
jgi:penicillin-binding protein 2